jgi:hypothetical protein
MFSGLTGISNGSRRAYMAYLAGCDGENFHCGTAFELAEWFRGFAYHASKVRAGL